MAIADRGRPGEWLRESAPRKASALSARLGPTDETLEAWRLLAGKVALRRDADGIWEHHAGFFELDQLDIESFAPRQAGMYDLVGEEQIEQTQVLKQADVVIATALFPELMSSRQVRRRTWVYCLSFGSRPFTADNDTNGSSARRIRPPVLDQPKRRRRNDET